MIDKVMTNWIEVLMKSIMTDNGGEFSSDETREVASVLGIEVITTAAESPFQNGLCERVHAVTDSILTKLVADDSEKPVEVLLSWANMARNSLQMWHGYSSYQLVFGKNPNLPNIMTDDLPALDGLTTSDILAEHLNTLHATRVAFIQSEADERIRRALRSKVRTSEQMFQNGDRVFYKREGKDRWLGPGKVVFQDGKVVFVRHGGIFVRVSPTRLMKAAFSKPLEMEQAEPGKVSSENSGVQESDGNISGKASVIPEIVSGSVNGGNGEIAMPPEVVPGTVNEDNVNAQRDQNTVNEDNVNAPSDQNTVSMPRQSDKIQYVHPGAEEWTDVTVLGKAGKATGKNRSWINVEYESGQKGSIDLDSVDWRKLEEVNVSTIKGDYNESQDSAEMFAKQKELQKLKDFEAYDLVDYKGQEAISTRWVITQKDSEVRARLVARGFEETSSVQKDSPTIAKSSLRILLSVSATFQWCIQTTDIKSAFLQSRPLDREVYILPPAEANVPDGQIWKLKRCLYGLNDAARQFYLSVDEELRKLGCTRSKLDPSLFYLVDNDILCGIIVTHIDDFLHAGNDSFDSRVMIPLRQRFQAGKLVKNSFRYIGFDVSQTKDGVLLDQNKYVDKIEPITVDEKGLQNKDIPLTKSQHTALRSLAGSLNWAVQGTRPDLAFELTEISMKFKKGLLKDLFRAQKTLRQLKMDKCQIMFPNMGPSDEWRLVVFTDAAHANLCDGVSSMGSHIVFIVGRFGFCAPVAWNGRKIKRVVRSTIAAETLSLQEGLEEAIYVRAILQEVKLGENMPVVAYIDNKSVVEALYSTKSVDDKRLRIDLGAIKETICKDNVIVKWIRGDLQLANSMTKRGASAKELLTTLYNGKLNVNV